MWQKIRGDSRRGGSIDRRGLHDDVAEMMMMMMMVQMLSWLTCFLGAYAMVCCWRQKFSWRQIKTCPIFSPPQKMSTMAVLGR